MGHVCVENQCHSASASRQSMRGLLCAIQLTCAKSVSVDSKEARSFAPADCCSCRRSIFRIHFAWAALASNSPTNVHTLMLVLFYSVSRLHRSIYAVTKYMETSSDAQKVTLSFICTCCRCASFFGSLIPEFCLQR